MSRQSWGIAVIGGANCYGGAVHLTEALVDGSAWGVLWSCVQLAIGIAGVVFARPARTGKADRP